MRVELGDFRCLGDLHLSLQDIMTTVVKDSKNENEDTANKLVSNLLGSDVTRMRISVDLYIEYPNICGTN